MELSDHEERLQREMYQAEIDRGKKNSHECPVCGAFVKMRKDGRLADHSFKRKLFNFGQRCPYESRNV